MAYPLTLAVHCEPEVALRPVLAHLLHGNLLALGLRHGCGLRQGCLMM